MVIDLITLMSFGVYFFSIYCAVYFFYTYLKKSRDAVPTLFHPGVTIIIPAYNEEKNIRMAVDSCLNQDYNGSIEVIVVDDGSTDKTRQICSEYVKKGLIKLILKNKPGSPTGKISSVNLGIKKAVNALVGILDADSYLEPNVFKELIGHFENPKVGAVVPLQKVHKPKSLLERIQSVEYVISFCIRRLMAYSDSLFITHGVGCIFRKSALREVGYFEEKTLTEDLNIALKLIKAGYLIRSSFKAIGYTKVPDNLKSLRKQRLRWNGGLCENIYWFKEMLINKRYGNLGLFMLPINLAWTGLMIYFFFSVVTESIKIITEALRDLVITKFDFIFFISERLSSIQLLKFNQMTMLNVISMVIFLIFYFILSRRMGFNYKQIITSLLILPFYFTAYFLLMGVFWVITPFYLIKRGGVGWSVKS